LTEDAAVVLLSMTAGPVSCRSTRVAVCIIIQLDWTGQQGVMRTPTRLIDAVV